jgi:hypothetical protein
MYEILAFPYKAEVANQSISAAFNYAATPPDFRKDLKSDRCSPPPSGI